LNAVRLGDVCHKITDGSHNPPKGVESSEYLMLSSKNVHNDRISYEKPRFLSKSDFEDENKRTDIQMGDVLLTIVGTIGRCAVFEEMGDRFTLQRSVAVLKPKHDLVLSRFMMFVLQSMLEVLNDGARGVAQKGIYLKSLKALPFLLPPLAEQQRIVAKLDAASSEFENANESIIKCKANYLALKSAILAQELQSEAA
jgi:type I restriction enzyme, S subunit